MCDDLVLQHGEKDSVLCHHVKYLTCFVSFNKVVTDMSRICLHQHNTPKTAKDNQSDNIKIKKPTEEHHWAYFFSFF